MGTAGDQEKLSFLPKDKIPRCWEDDLRMSSLFAPFRECTVNPLDWESKLQFWSALINDWCIYNKQPQFTLTELRSAFQRKGKRPACLLTVLQEMNKKREIIPAQEFFHIAPQETWTSWTINLLLKKPIVWSLNKMKEAVSKPLSEEDKLYVHLGACQILGEQLLSEFESQEQMLDMQQLGKKTKLGNSLEVVLHGLRRQGKVGVACHRGATIVKFNSGEITEMDLAIHSLQQNEHHLKHHVEQLEAEKQVVMEDARTYLMRGLKQRAKNCLRKKRELDRCIDKRESTLNNVQLLLSRIQEAASDSKVLSSYQMGLSALKNVLKDTGLTEENVANTMLEVDEVLDVHSEIQKMLSQQTGEDNTVEEDLEKELEQLILADKIPAADTVHPGKQTEEEGLEKELDQLSLSEKMPAVDVVHHGKALVVDFPMPPDTEPSSFGSSTKKKVPEMQSCT